MRDIEDLVKWMTRNIGYDIPISFYSSNVSFEINDKTWKNLTILSDKYEIGALHKDICVSPSQNLLMTENYTIKKIWGQCPCTFEEWRFAARHNLDAFENYQRTTDSTWEIIKFILGSYEGGVNIFLQDGIPLAIVDRIVRQLVSSGANGKHHGWCLLCDDGVNGNTICETCGKKQLQAMASK